MDITTGLSFKFYLQLNKSRGDGKHPIYLRLVYKSKKIEIATDYDCEEKDFNIKQQRTIRNHAINEGLTKMEAKVHSSVRKLEDAGAFIDLSAIKDELKGKSKFDKKLLEYYNEHLKYVQSNPQLAKNTKNRYLDTQKHLIKFIKSVKKRSDVSIESVDYKFISDFDLFLLNQPSGKTLTSTLHRNTANKHITRFKTVILKAFNEGIIKKNPFTNIRVKYTPTTITYLTQEELDMLEAHDLSGNESLQKSRDIFLFSCYTGLRFKDALSLDMNKIVFSKANGNSIRIKQEKTDEYVEMPVLKQTQAIIDRYDGEYRKITGKVLPQISNQKVNAFLKMIADAVGIKKRLTHHMARHTCATTVLLSQNVPLEVVSKWLGHNSIKSTQVYGKITNKYMMEHAKRLNEIIK